MLSTTTMFHPGLAFATLVVQFATANGSPLSALNFRGDDDAAVDNILVNVGKLYPRHDNGCEDNGEHCSTASTVPTTAASNSTVVQTSTPTNSSTSPTSSSTPSGTPTSSSAVQGPSQTSIDSHDRNMGISTGGIIGTAFGAFVLVIATLIICGLLYRRWRRSRNHPQASLPPMYKAGPPPPFNGPFPPTEMSQTQSSPLVALAVASRMTSTPPRHYPPSSTTGSMSPLITAGSLGHSLSITSSSNRRTSLSYTDGDSSHEPLHSTQEAQVPTSYLPSGLFGSDFAGGLAGIILGSTTTPASPTAEPSNLVRAMTAYQKSLEAEDQKSSQSGASTSDVVKQEEQDITESHDPPPSYDA